MVTYQDIMSQRRMTSPAFLVYEIFAPIKILFQGPQTLQFL